MRKLQISLPPEMRCEQFEDRDKEHRMEAWADMSYRMRKETNESERNNPVAGQEHGSNTDGAEAAQS